MKRRTFKLNLSTTNIRTFELGMHRWKRRDYGNAVHELEWQSVDLKIAVLKMELNSNNQDLDLFLQMKIITIMHNWKLFDSILERDIGLIFQRKFGDSKNMSKWCGLSNWPHARYHPFARIFEAYFSESKNVL